MQLKFPAALQLAKKAIERDERCFEAYSALAAAELSLKRIVEATVAFDQSSPRVPFDLDGHALRLLTVALFAEAIANMVEDDEGLQIDFLLTPATLCVIRILDGDPHLGVKHAEMEDSVPAALALGAAYYFLGRPQRARSEWKRCESAFPADGRNAPIRLSLARLMSGSP
jgi:tetratricopeptide (TPR) repeat protein